MDIKPGYMLGGKPRHQAIGHVLGILAGALASRGGAVGLDIERVVNHGRQRRADAGDRPEQLLRLQLPPQPIQLGPVTGFDHLLDGVRDRPPDRRQAVETGGALAHRQFTHGFGMRRHHAGRAPVRANAIRVGVLRLEKIGEFEQGLGDRFVVPVGHAHLPQRVRGLIYIIRPLRRVPVHPVPA